MARALTPKQQRFVDLYDGNGTEAARLAGYGGNDNVLAVTARDLLRNPKIDAAIKARIAKSAEGRAIKRRIASREERQEFWTRTMEDDGEEMPVRLKASELLAKSQADFVQKHEHSGPDGKPIEFSDHEAAAKLAAILNAARSRKAKE